MNMDHSIVVFYEEEEENRMRIGMETRSITRRPTYPSATLSTTNPT
jgi:hypothetical protein